MPTPDPGTAATVPPLIVDSPPSHRGRIPTQIPGVQVIYRTSCSYCLDQLSPGTVCDWCGHTQPETTTWQETNR